MGACAPAAHGDGAAEGAVRANRTQRDEASPAATLGIDLGGTSVKLGVVIPGRDEVAYFERLDTGAHRPRDAVVADIAAAASEIARRARRDEIDVVALGVGIPATLDRAGRIEVLPNFAPGWRGFAVHEALRSATGLPSVTVNDARAFTLAEATVGAGAGRRAVLGVTLGTGVGGGLFLDGDLYLGPTGNAGELGHHVMDPTGPRCGCGGYGCLETFASATAIVGAVTRPFLQGAAPALRELAGGRLEAVTAELVVEAARAGDPACADAVAKATHWLGVAIANAATLVAIDTAVVGGGLAGAGDAVLGPVRESVARHAPVLGSDVPEIRPARLGARAGVLGAGMQAARLLAGTAT